MFFEISGKIICKYETGTELELICEISENVAPTVMVEIKAQRNQFLINEGVDKYIVLDSNGNLLQNGRIGFKFQSDLTSTFLESLLKGSPTLLPDVKESSQIHLNFFGPVRDFLVEHKLQKNEDRSLFLFT